MGYPLWQELYSTLELGWLLLEGWRHGCPVTEHVIQLTRGDDVFHHKLFGEGIAYRAEAFSMAAETAAIALPEEDKPFRCGICLDLVYKPIVHACGHLFCFWCVHRAMSGIAESHCPMCRSSYTHFPRICELLHKFLAKAFPNEFKEREKEVKAEELKNNSFSPEFELSLAEQQNDTLIAEGGGQQNNQAMAKDETLTTADLICKACNRLICGPVVLNCGHAFCQACLPSRQGRSLKCPSCEIFHHIYPLKVCLELHEYLKQAFPLEYTQREMESVVSSPVAEVDVQASQGNVSDECRTYIHPFAGCDSCGVLPIRGRRFKCLDCEDKMGYDLCEDCYQDERCNLTGRFNQRHTREHRMVEANAESVEAQEHRMADLHFMELLHQSPFMSEIWDMYQSPPFMNAMLNQVPSEAQDQQAIYDEDSLSAPD